jgi:leader peptidase (prepilin peptidase) / N-methyltransferase
VNRGCRASRARGRLRVIVTAVSAAAWVAVLAVGLFGFLAGAGVNRAAGAFPWGDRPAGTGRREAAQAVALLARSRRLAVRPPLLETGTAVLLVLTALRFGASWELPAFLFLAVVAVLLAVIDLRHLLLPDRVVLPSLGIGAGLLAVAAAGTGDWAALLRAGLGAGTLFGAFLVLALISPRSLGMGDVKLAALLGLFLGWLGWPVLALGAAAGFVVQALVGLVLLAGRRIGLRGELPFGPAMLAGAVLALAVG